MRQSHRIKLNWRYADAVLTGEKPFEIRYNDRGYQKGDLVLFEVVMDDCKLHATHPLNEQAFVITYLVHGFGLEKDWCVFGIRPAPLTVRNVAELPSLFECSYCGWSCSDTLPCDSEYKYCPNCGKQLEVEPC